jgi:hypothetical protein
MGKKQRRKQQPQRTTPQSAPAVSAAPAVQATIAPEPRKPSAPAVTGARSRPSMSWSELQERYSYVNGELKQIGILAGSFLVVLLILTAVLG